MTDLLSLTPEELRIRIKEFGLPEYRAKQIQEWLTRGCRDFAQMSNLPKNLRETLAEEFTLTAPVLLRRQVSKEDGTEKFLWGLADGNSVETVFMRYHYGNSVCISSQVGCRQGCCFCASTIGGLVRNLTAGEMLDEVLFSEKEAGDRISNIVLMGIGEPLDNLDQVLRFLRLISHPDGRNIGLRHITLSTCGLPEGIDRLADENMPITLSLSLHAPEDALRSKLMPSNRGIDTVLDACRRYQEKTGRRISFEYSMIRDTNDSPAQAEALAAHARRIGAHVNLIPLNYVEERGLQPSSGSTIRAFQSILEQNGVTVTVRRRLGSDIDASCGQLRRKYTKAQ
ncbi:MAG: 23S rRNA (adenine(2503)-C(2))-methyltransferase RlmN [Oscillospiraceae bacterium]|nr:23S rRNA (adenine(2503)-C(2))-methyltransferase RlmN [Oscillospiraceae bacterium]